MKKTTSPETAAGAERRTRARVAQLLLEQGPATAATLGTQLGLSPAAIRRHLDAMLIDGTVAAEEAVLDGPRGRGRPARLFGLTESGRDAFPHAYDDLAAAALRFLAEQGGTEAVQAFATARVQELENRYRTKLARLSPARRVEALAAALSEDGYAATAKNGEVCQHHCPVQHVAEEFPELCAAETEVFARLLGKPVIRLTTIAHGESCCTARIGTEPPERTAR